MSVDNQKIIRHTQICINKGHTGLGVLHFKDSSERFDGFIQAIFLLFGCALSVGELGTELVGCIFQSCSNDLKACSPFLSWSTKQIGNTIQIHLLDCLE